MTITRPTSWSAWAVVLVLWLATMAALSGPLFPFTPQPSGLDLAQVPDLDLYLRQREALAIGRCIGERVILIGTSTGALLATMAALEDDSPRVAALVLLSPNFGIRDWRAKFISGPLGRVFAQIIIGGEYSFRPDSRGHAEFWTSRYPSQAIVALMDLVNYGRALHLDNLKVPTLIIYTDKDTVIDTKAIQDRFDEITGSPKLLIDLPEASRHELTGDALAPETVRPVLRQIMSFLADSGVVGPTSADGSH